MSSSAIISKCGKYRYRLSRRWRRGGVSRCIFIMLNPSTADAKVNDPTIRRCVGYANNWGYNGIEVVNLFAYRATSPHELKWAVNPIGIDNDKHILETIKETDGPIICAWGTKGNFMDRDKDVIKLIEDIGRIPMCISHTKERHPGHPLYLPTTLKLRRL